MANDIGRTDLITRFFCRECGGKLNVSYDQHEGRHDAHESGDPTGAQCRYSSIFIWPCKRCIEKHTAPAKAMAAAIKSMAEES